MGRRRGGRLFVDLCQVALKQGIPRMTSKVTLEMALRMTFEVSFGMTLRMSPGLIVCRMTVGPVKGRGGGGGL